MVRQGETLRDAGEATPAANPQRYTISHIRPKPPCSRKAVFLCLERSDHMTALFILLIVLEANDFIIPQGCKVATLLLLALSLAVRIIAAAPLRRK